MEGKPPAWYEPGLRHVWLPYVQMKTMRAPLAVTRTEGSRIVLNDGREVARGRIGRTAFVAAGLGETFDIGRDTGATVVDLPGGTRFNGAIARIEVGIR